MIKVKPFLTMLNVGPRSLEKSGLHFELPKLIIINYNHNANAGFFGEGGKYVGIDINTCPLRGILGLPSLLSTM